VLACWDGSDKMAVLDRAVDMTRPGDVTLCLAVSMPRTLTLTERPKAALNPEVAKFLHELNLEHIRLLTERAEAMLASDPRYSAVTLVIRQGIPAPVIAEEVGRQHVSILVLGSHGAGFAERLLLGSTVEEVLHTAAAPVILVVKTHHDAKKL
jgi:nucleotide-binding universal stress UspA family protein